MDAAVGGEDQVAGSAAGGDRHRAGAVELSSQGALLRRTEALDRAVRVEDPIAAGGPVNGNAHGVAAGGQAAGFIAMSRCRAEVENRALRAQDQVARAGGGGDRLDREVAGVGGTVVTDDARTPGVLVAVRIEVTRADRGCVPSLTGAHTMRDAHGDSFGRHAGVLDHLAVALQCHPEVAPATVNPGALALQGHGFGYAFCRATPFEHHAAAGAMLSLGIEAPGAMEALPGVLAPDVVGDRDFPLHDECAAQTRCGGATRATGHRRAQQAGHANRRREPSHWLVPISSEARTPLTLPT